ncbi:SUMO-activating enzyme subunit 1 [Rhodotorula toruloides]|uniref:SUMO-activating enzyme subunit 1 n=1 Tax=Rhodotorula toruloides TaxID=5286 RepID=A0A511KCJ4_RHOTO|nr:SUMO-activating enzyme subunit 1 [Rhodotorula toruloides]
MPAPAPREKAITEDEAKLYDRQLRLWGAAAQARMLASRVLVAGRFRGIAVDAVKNVVLAGVGQLTLLDGEDLMESDLGTNYFAREDEVGKKRVEVSAPRVQALNPRVTVSTETDPSLLFQEAFLDQFDLVVVTDVDAPTVLKVNDLTRQLGKKFFASGSVGIDGWMFADLLEHEFVVDKIKTVSQGETVTVPTKSTLSYVPFSLALEHDFSILRKREMKRSGAVLWGMLSLFAAQRIANPSPSAPIATTVSETDLSSAAQSLLPKIGVSIDMLPSSEISRIATLQEAEFAPAAAIVGGILGQDVLNAVGGKEEPARNLFVFQGATGVGRVWALGV